MERAPVHTRHIVEDNNRYLCLRCIHLKIDCTSGFEFFLIEIFQRVIRAFVDFEPGILRDVFGGEMPDWIPRLPSLEAFDILVAIILVQTLVFGLVWCALRHEQRLSLRLRRKDVHCPKLKRGILRLSSPHGAIFPVFGILGTFVGLAFNVSHMDAYIASVQAVSLEPTNAELRATRDANLETVLDGVYVSLCSTIFGILFYFLARICWPHPDARRLEYCKVEDLLGRYSSIFDWPQANGNLRIEERDIASGLYIDTVRVLLEEMNYRTHLPHNQITEKVNAFTELVSQRLNLEENKATLEEYASGHHGYDVSPTDLDDQLARLKSVVHTTEQHI